MIARLLNLGGLYLGDESKLIQPKPDNPAGFWENLSFLELNEQLLLSVNSSWDLPPSAERVEQLGSSDTAFFDKAEALSGQFGGKEPWGWKDPRNSLTLPFWNKVFPEMKVIVCLRSPVDVFQSLNRRGGSSYLFALFLWLTYNRMVFLHTNQQRMIITHYDAYFLDPRAELTRVLEFIGIEADDATLEQACSIINPELRHANTNPGQLAETGAPENIVNLYKKLCAQAGPVCKRTTNP